MNKNNARIILKIIAEQIFRLVGIKAISDDEKVKIFLKKK